MSLIFLGTGTSTGVPQIGCNCTVCSSTNAKDKRLRSSVLVTVNEKNILIDCGPDFRQQMLIHKIDTIAAVLITHEHYDHVSGLDDLRPLGKADVYAEKKVIATIERNMPYCFGENKYPNVPTIHLHQIDENEFYIDDLKIQPIRVMHAKLPILGYRIGNLAYLTDVKTIAASSYEQLKNLDVLIINALRKSKHISHLSLEEALEIEKKIGAKKTYFTHISHDMGLHEVVNDTLPPQIQIAFDGMTIE